MYCTVPFLDSWTDFSAFLFCYSGCREKLPAHTGLRAYPLCERNKEPNCVIESLYNFCRKMTCESPIRKDGNSTKNMGPRPQYPYLPFSYFGVKEGNGSWADAKERCSGWEEDAADIMHIKDRYAFMQLYLRIKGYNGTYRI